MRIAAVIPEVSPNAEYRVLQPMRELGRRGHRVRVWLMPELRDARELLDYDVLYAWRLHGDAFCGAARMMVNGGGALVWDNDDDLRAIDKPERLQRKHYGGYRGHRVFGVMVTLMRLSSVVTTPSPALATRYAEASGADVRVVENHVESIVAPPRRRWWERPAEQERVTIGWVASYEHLADIEALGLRAQLQRLLDELPDVEIVTIGCSLGLSGDRARHMRGCDFSELRTHVGGFDIGIAPIADTSFNRARSNIKVKEYAALGVPWLASPAGPYAGFGEREGGQLVADDRWFESLRDLVRDVRRRRRLGRRGLAWAQTETIAANGHQWEAVLQDAAASRTS